MNVIVDTNIVFSGILNTNGAIGDLLFNSNSNIVFCSPNFMKDEIFKYYSKLQKLSKLPSAQLDLSIAKVISQINLIAEESISHNSWTSAYELAKDIDENDTPFVALTIELNGVLWTGDKKLMTGLSAKLWNNFMSTKEFQELRGY